MNSESHLINEFKTALLQRFGKSVDVYKILSTAYSEQGQPDLEVNFAFKKQTIYVETKKADSGESAIKNLRATQIGRITKLTKVNKVVFVLFHGGCCKAKLTGNKLDFEIVVDSDNIKFSAFFGFIDKAE